MNPERDRKKLFRVLNDFIEVSHEKFLIRNLKSKERRAWARIGKDCIATYGKLLEVHELELLAKDVKAIKAKVGIP